MSRKRILLILPEFPPSIGGMQAHAHYLSLFLHQNNYSILVLTYRYEKHTLNAQKYFDNSQPYPVKRILSRIGYWLNIHLIQKEIKEFRPDLIYSSTVFYGFLKQKTSIPIVSRSVGNDVLRPWIGYPFKIFSSIFKFRKLEELLNQTARKIRSPEWIDRIFLKKRYKLMRKALSFHDAVIANSHFTENLLLHSDFDASRIHTVIGGVDIKVFSRDDSTAKKNLRLKFNVPENSYVILTACRLVRKKGIEFLLDSFKLIKDIIPDCLLVIAGDGPCRKKFESLAEKLEIKNQVIFKGAVPHPEIQNYFWLSDLFVLPSYEFLNKKTGLKDAETMGRVLCEANSAGIPVIASNSGGIPSIITHNENGLLFQAGDKTDFINQVNSIYSSAELRKQLVEAGCKKAKEIFDWNIVLKKNESILLSVLNSSLK